MATVQITVAVTANGNTPFSASELAEVTSYLQNVLDHNGIKGAIPDIEFRLANASPESIVYFGEGSFL